MPGWAAKVPHYNAAPGATAGTYQDAGGQITLNPGESCVVQISHTHAATAAADMLFQVLVADDNSGTTYDTLPYLSGSLAKGANSGVVRRTFCVYGVPAFKIQCTGSVAEVFTNLTITYKKDGISA